MATFKNKEVRMLSKTNRQPKGGFTLLELTVVLIIVTILTSAVIPQFINAYTVKAANKTALDISAVEEACRAYYIANSQWPANIAILQALIKIPLFLCLLTKGVVSQAPSRLAPSHSE